VRGLRENWTVDVWCRRVGRRASCDCDVIVWGGKCDCGVSRVEWKCECGVIVWGVSVT
jgi:hypothetical protein